MHVCEDDENHLMDDEDTDVYTLRVGWRETERRGAGPCSAPATSCSAGYAFPWVPRAAMPFHGWHLE